MQREPRQCTEKESGWGGLQKLNALLKRKQMISGRGHQETPLHKNSFIYLYFFFLFSLCRTVDFGQRAKMLYFNMKCVYVIGMGLWCAFQLSSIDYFLQAFWLCVMGSKHLLINFVVVGYSVLTTVRLFIKCRCGCFFFVWGRRNYCRINLTRSDHVWLPNEEHFSSASSSFHNCYFRHQNFFALNRSFRKETATCFWIVKIMKLNI